MPGGFPLGLDICNGNSAGANTAASLGTAVVAGNQAYGSYTQLIASTPSDTCFIVVTVQSNAASNTGFGTGIKIAVGAAASEKDIITGLMLFAPGNGFYQNCYCFPVSIPAGTRISAAAAGTAGTDTVYVSAILFDGAFTQMEGCAGVDGIGQAGGGSFGTQVTSGATINTKGSFTQIVASTSKDYLGLSVIPCQYQNGGISFADEMLCDVAIGPAAAEQVIIPNITELPLISTLGEFRGLCQALFPILIPSGTRLSVRTQTAVNASLIVGFVLNGLYQ